MFQINVLYLILCFFNFFFSGVLIFGLRLELFKSGFNLFLPNFSYSLITSHGILMIFGFILPILNNFNQLFYLNLIYNRKDGFFFLRILSFFFFIIFELIFILINFLPLNLLNMGWTFYLPLSLQLDLNFDIFIISILIVNISFFISSINTILNLLKFYNFRIKSLYITTVILSSYLNLIIVPILISLSFIIFYDKYFKINLFFINFKSNILFFQHLFWFFGHPEVYIIILPCFGISSYIISIFCRKKIYGLNIMNYTLISISILSLIVWGHHMFLTGLPIIGNLFFMYCTLFISIPTGLKIFNWLYTIFNSDVLINISFIYCLSFFYFFIIGGMSGIIISLIPLNYYYHGSYFIVGHFHYIMVSCVLSSIFSFFYYICPLIYKIKYNSINSSYHFWFSFIFLNLTFFPMHILGIKGLGRRYIDYNLKYTFYNKFISFSSIFLSLSQIYFLYYIINPILKW